MQVFETLEPRALLSAAPVISASGPAQHDAVMVAEQAPLQHVVSKSAKRVVPFTPSSPQTYMARDWEGIYKVKGSGVSVYFQKFLKQSGKNVTGQMVTFSPDGNPVAWFKVKGTIDQYGKFTLNVTGNNFVPGFGMAKGNSAFKGQVSKNGKTLSGTWSGTVQASGMTIKSAGAWYGQVF